MTDDEKLTHTFDYLDETEGSFLKWAMLTFVPPHDEEEGREWFAAASEATNNFHDIELKISISGVEVDAERFMKRLDSAMDDMVERAVSQRLADMRPRFMELEDMISDLTWAFNERAREIAEHNGINVDTEDWRSRR